MPQERRELLEDIFLRPQHCAAETSPLPIDVLGRRIDDDVGAERQRLLQQRRSEDIVDDEDTTSGMRHFGNRFKINQLEPRVGWAFAEGRGDAAPERALPLIEIRSE